jgi:hypothetical protein
MKALRAALVLAGILLAAPAFAQTTLDSLQMARADIAADRKAVITGAMGFTDTESAAFWPVYNDYRAASRKIDDKMVSLIQQADSTIATVDTKSAQAMVTQWMALAAEKATLRKTYVPRFGKALPPKKLIRYYQLENKMDAIIAYALAANVPLVK